MIDKTVVVVFFLPEMYTIYTAPRWCGTTVA